LSLERKLPLIMSALLLVVLGTCLVVVYREIHRSAELVMAERVKRIGRQLTNLPGGGNRARNIRTLAVSPLVTRAVSGLSVDTAAVRLALHRLGVITDSSFPVELWTADGRLVAAAGGAAAPQPPLEGPRPPDDVIPRLTGADSIAVGPLFVDGNRTHYWAVAKVMVGDSTAGYVAHRRRLAGSPVIEQLLGEFAGERIAIYARNDRDDVWTTLSSGAPAHPARIDVAIADSAAVASYDRRGVGPVTAASTALDGTPWQLVVEVPQEAMIARARKSTIRIAAVSALFILGGIVVTWLIGRRLTRPLGELTLAAEAVAGGDFTHHVRADRGDEIGRLATSFNRMAGEVQASQVELAEQVMEAKSLARELERANERLHATAAEAGRDRDAAEKARAAAMAANRAKSDFLATMSHEIRTPINAVMGYTELMELGLSGPLTDAQRLQLARIRTSTEHLMELVTGILDVAKIESRSMQVEREEAPIGATVDAALSLIRPQAAARGIDLSDVCEGACEAIYVGDEYRVRQVLVNLLANAVKFTEPGGRVEVRCTVSPAPPGTHAMVVGRRYVACEVKDTGVGVPPAQHEAIFEPFTQGESASGSTYTRERTGAGLGLAISRELARLMGGDVTVASTPGEGSAFTLWLPMADPPRSSRAGGDSATEGDTPDGGLAKLTR
jgi:signal transduction histidine kinase